MAKDTDKLDSEKAESTRPERNAEDPMASDEEQAMVEAPEAATDGDAPGEAADSDESEELINALRIALSEAHGALEESRAEATYLKDQALRAAAEADNVRKRADRSIENAHKYALERFVNDLLPAVDSFERAVDAAAQLKASTGEAASAIAEGMALSLKLLMEAMQRHGIEVVDPIGAPFDPNLHEAMSMIENPEAEPGSVIEVFQKGYGVNGRLVRAARVIVAKKPVSEADPEA